MKSFGIIADYPVALAVIKMAAKLQTIALNAILSINNGYFFIEVCFL